VIARETHFFRFSIQMAKHPTSSRVHREAEGPDDPFVAAIERTMSWARSHSTALTIAGVLLAVLVIVGVYYVSSQRRIEASAQAAYASVQQTMTSGNTQLAIRDLQGFLDRFGESRAAGQARVALAGLLLAEGRADEALEALGDLPEDIDEPFGLAAARLQGAANEALGEPDRAVQAYMRIADQARFDFQRREALGDAARVRLQNGSPHEAADLYARVLDLFGENEPGRGYYAMWHAEAQAQAARGAGTTPTAADSVADTASSGSATG
jgi:predicted negative regulator of RcsB-dependent stress response